jgi:ABC-type amino acid transport substrate-binding protein
VRPALRLITPIAVAFAVAGPVGATDIRTVAQEGAFPKFVALEHAGKPPIGGLCVDIMRAIERIEPELHFVGDQQWVPLIRIEVGMTAGKIDAACGLIRTSERKAKFDFIDTPLFPVNYLLVVRAADDVQVKDWADVRKLGEHGVILTIHGFVGILSHLREVGGLRIDTGGRDTKVNLEKLLAGRGRFFVHRSPGVAAEVASSGLRDKVKILPTIMYSETFYMMVAKSMAPAVRDKMNRALTQLAASGELAKLSKKWDERGEGER